MAVRTRFAPSPTGYLHVGGARTALFAWLYAKSQGGQFILRIEDTDRERSTEPSIQAILDAMAWLGLDYDEGPYYQTQRFPRYAEVIQQLLVDGHAYRCFCSKSRLDALREQQMQAKQKPQYDGHCRELDPAELDLSQPHVIRFKNPQQGSVQFTDAVYGDISVSNTELDDLIIARGDGTPTYNFTVVVDDMDMAISHVIRGDDHINNTPRQINILRALGATLPVYAHVPIIVGADGKRLSKRHGATSVMHYHEAGFLADAMLNYLVRLGWSHGDEEIFSRQAMIECFSLAAINRAPAGFNFDKLQWLNQHYIKETPTTVIADALQSYFQVVNVDISHGPALETIVELQRERAKTLVEMVEKSVYFYQDVTSYDEKAVKKHLSTDSIPLIQQLRVALTALDVWQPSALHELLQQVAEAASVKLGKLAQPLRIAVSGGTVSPSIDVTLCALGKNKVLQRIDALLEFLQLQQGA